MTAPKLPEQKTKRADQLTPGDLLDDNFYDGVQVVLSAHRFVDCGEQGVYAVIRDEDGGVYSREFDPAVELPVKSAPEPIGYQAVAAELRRIAAGLDTLPPTERKPFTQVHVLPVEKTAEAVDAIGLAVLGVPGVTEESGQGFRRRVKNGFEGVVRFTSFVEVPNPANGRDVELEKLRAKVAELEKLTYSREADDPTPVSPARPPLHVGVREADGGELVDETPVDPVHYLEPGSDGEDGDRVACGVLIGQLGEYAEDLAKATCPACARAMGHGAR